MLILTILVVGLTAGWLAHLMVQPGTQPNWGRLFIAGLVGSFVGGTIFSLLMGDGFAIRPSGLIGSILGAVVVLLIAQAFGAPNARTQN